MDDLPLTLSFVPSSATNSPFLFRQLRCFEKDMTLVSRAWTTGPDDDASGLRTAAGGGVEVAAGAAIEAAALVAAFRFFDVPVVMDAVGVDSLAVDAPPAPLLTAINEVASGARFGSAPGCVAVADVSLDFFFAPPFVAAEEYSKSISWSSA